MATQASERQRHKASSWRHIWLLWHVLYDRAACRRITVRAYCGDMCLAKVYSNGHVEVLSRKFDWDQREFAEGMSYVFVLIVLKVPAGFL